MDAKGKMLFSFPTNGAQVAALIDSIPDDWGQIRGAISAPATKILNGEAVESTGARIGSGDSIHPTYFATAKDAARNNARPDLLAMLVERRMPGVLEFEEAGWRTHLVHYREAKKIAAAYILLGYGAGRLEFLRYRSYEQHSVFAEVNLFWGNDEPHYRPYVFIEWLDEEHRKAVEPLIAECRRLGLAELPTK